MKRVNRRQVLKSGIATGTVGLVAGCTGNSDGSGDGNDDGSGDGNDDGSGDGNDDGSGDGNDGGSDFPSEALTGVVAYDEGGGVDREFRQIQPYFTEEVGVEVAPEYIAGAGTRRGVRTVLEADDLHTYGMVASPEAGSAVAFDDAEGNDTGYGIDDLMPIGNHVSQMSILRIREDEDRFTTIEELVDYAADNEVTVGASGPTKRNMLANIKLAEATEAEFQYVPYSGGGPTQTALLQGEIDVANRSVYNSLDIIEDSKCIGVFWDENTWPELTGDAPAVNDALGTDIDFAGTVGRYYWFVSAALAEENPDQFDHLVESYREAMESDEYISKLEGGDLDESGKLDYMGPEETLEANIGDYETYQEFIPLFNEYVQN